MRQDRFFLGILVGVGVLVALALVVFFTRPTGISYVEDGTAAGVVQDYLTALYARDYERAYQFVADAPDKVSFDIFRQEVQNSLSDQITQTTVEVGAAELDASGQTASVPLTLVSGGGFLESASRSLERVDLVRQGEEWKILWAPYPFWVYGWTSPVTPSALPTPTGTP